MCVWLFWLGNSTIRRAKSANSISTFTFDTKVMHFKAHQQQEVIFHHFWGCHQFDLTKQSGISIISIRPTLIAIPTVPILSPLSIIPKYLTHWPIKFYRNDTNFPPALPSWEKDLLHCLELVRTRLPELERVLASPTSSPGDFLSLFAKFSLQFPLAE